MSEEYKPHPSHRMTPWRETIVTLVATSRFGDIRKCKLCEAEHARTVAGEAHHPELDVPCPYAIRVKAAAIKTVEGKVFTGRDHAATLHAMKAAGEPPPRGHKDGFVDTEDNFLNRFQAADLALKIGQIKKLGWPHMGLDSSDLMQQDPDYLS